jgi:hypothetical protein
LEHFSGPSVLLDESTEIEAGAEGEDRMQALRDAAALGILILLALTVRVDLNGKPIGLDIASPAEAAVEQAVPLDLRPAFISQPASAAQPVPAAHESEHHSWPGATQHIALPVVPRTVAPGREETEQREFVWEVDGRRIVIVLDAVPSTEGTSPSASAPEPCDGKLRARLSC